MCGYRKEEERDKADAKAGPASHLSESISY